MGKLLLVLMTVTMLFTLGCASKAPTASSAPAAEMASDNSGLPEIAAYDDEAFEALPDMVAAGEI